MEERALRVYENFTNAKATTKKHERYVDKTPKPTTYSNNKSHTNWRRDK